MTDKDTFLTCRVPFEIRYLTEVDCNGFDYHKHVLKYITKHYQNGFFHCCGHGNIGMHLLYQQQVQHMHFCDIYQPALIGCQATCDLYGWSASFSNNLVDQQYDLFIADPPWWPELWEDQIFDDHKKRRLIDQDWQTHREMFRWLPEHLTKDGDVYITKDRNDAAYYDLIPTDLEVQGEYPFKYFAPGPRSVRVRTGASLLHLRHR